MILREEDRKKSFNVKISFNLEIIGYDPQDAIRMAINKVQCPGMIAANMEADIVNVKYIIEGDEEYGI
jgi:hypothetical protein